MRNLHLRILNILQKYYAQPELSPQLQPPPNPKHVQSLTHTHTCLPYSSLPDAQMRNLEISLKYCSCNHACGPSGLYQSSPGRLQWLPQWSSWSLEQSLPHSMPTVSNLLNKCLTYHTPRWKQNELFKTFFWLHIKWKKQDVGYAESMTLFA